MNEVTKQNKLKEVLRLVEKHKITSYELAKNTSLTEAGVGRIVKKLVKSPHTSTVNELYDYVNDQYNLDPVQEEISDVKLSIINKDQVDQLKNTGAGILDNLELFIECKIDEIVKDQVGIKASDLYEKINMLFENNQTLLKEIELLKKIKKPVKNIN